MTVSKLGSQVLQHDHPAGLSLLAMPGEAAHEAGRDGAIRAKRWLEATTRVDVHWVNPDAVAKLTFSWQDASSFSFDLGGVLHGGDVDGKEFFAEVKKYSNASDQGSLYESYLAKCYQAYMSMPYRCDHFMWITWHPFSLGKWKDLCSVSEVASAVAKYSALVINGDEPDPHDLKAVADRLWMFVLSDRQESLVIEADYIDTVISLRRKRSST